MRKLLTSDCCVAFFLLLVTWLLYVGPDYLLPTSIYYETFNIHTELTALIAFVIACKVGVFKKVLTTFYYKNLFMFILYLVLGFVFIYFCYRIYFSLVPALETVSDNEIRLWDFLHTIPTWEGKLIVYILGPMFEELIFREYLYRLLKWKWLAFFVSSVFFAWVHSSFTISFFYYLPMGLTLGLVYQRRRVVTESMMAHGLLNFIIDNVPAFTMYM